LFCFIGSWEVLKMACSQRRAPLRGVVGFETIDRNSSASPLEPIKQLAACRWRFGSWRFGRQ
jgi:hypothetical protein